MANQNKTREPTFSPEALAAIVMAVRAELDASKARKPAKVQDTSGKTAKQIANEKATITAFKKAGFGAVVPHDDVKTFNRWLAVGMRPVEGSKALKVKNMRLFHKTQVRELTAEEIAGNNEKTDAKMAKIMTDKIDFEEGRKDEQGNVIPLTQ